MYGNRQSLACALQRGRRQSLLSALLLIGGFLLLGRAYGVETLGINDPLHGYYTRATADRMSRLLHEIDSGQKAIAAGGELVTLRSLLQLLDVPEASQMLVYSVTSLQKNLISPRRPRALFFNEDTYVGYVPGGRLEIISVDPDIGSVFYISDKLVTGRAPRISRSDECMNCHAPHYMENAPTLALESVVPGITGGGEKAFRRRQSGHTIPISDRFGGWHLTGTDASFPKNWANRIIDYRDGKAVEIPISIGQLFPISNYPRAGSDALAQLLHEHQVGFANRAIQFSYRTRTLLASDAAGAQGSIDEMAEGLVKYMLFADEAALPRGSLAPDHTFIEAFLGNRRKDGLGSSLKDLSLDGRLMKHRCSYMIYSPEFAGLPPPLKSAVLAKLRAALDPKAAQPEFSYLPATEKNAIRRILTATFPEFSAVQAVN